MYKKRRKFLLVGWLALPVSAFARLGRWIAEKKPFRVDAGQDRFNEGFTYRGNRFLLKVSAEDTDGQLCVYDTTRVKKGGPR